MNRLVRVATVGVAALLVAAGCQADDATPDSATPTQAAASVRLRAALELFDEQSFHLSGSVDDGSTVDWRIDPTGDVLVGTAVGGLVTPETVRTDSPPEPGSQDVVGADTDLWERSALDGESVEDQVWYHTSIDSDFLGLSTWGTDLYRVLTREHGAHPIRVTGDGDTFTVTGSGDPRGTLALDFLGFADPHDFPDAITITLDGQGRPMSLTGDGMDVTFDDYGEPVDAAEPEGEIVEE